MARFQKFFAAFGTVGGGSFQKNSVFFWLGLAIAALALFSRAPGHFTAPELYAEDGRIWFQEAYDFGWRSLLWPKVGYLQTVSRLAALLGLALPMSALPLFFALIAFAAQLAPAALLLGRRAAALIPSLPARLLLVAYYIAVPNSRELFVNLTNAMWHLALLAFLLVLLPKPRRAAGLALDLALLVLSGVSGPFVLFLAPVAWWHVFVARRAPGNRWRLAYAGVVSLCAALQGWMVASMGVGPRVPSAMLGPTPSRLAHILADQIFLGGVLGGVRVTPLLYEGWWMRPAPAALCCAAGLALCLFALARGPDIYRQFMLFAGLILAAALRLPMVISAAPQWQLMQYPGAGGRYFVIPMLAWFTTLLVLAAGQGWPRWPARGLICLCLIGIFADWTYLPYVTTGYQAAAARFAAAPAGTVVTFPENPPPWQFALTKK